jgi:hypothetical protein
MYSPKIDPDLIHQLYLLGKKRGVPMTKLVNRIIEDFLVQENLDKEDDIFSLATLSIPLVNYFCSINYLLEETECLAHFNFNYAVFGK